MSAGRRLGFLEIVHDVSFWTTKDKAPLFQMKSPAEAGLFLSECSSWISVRSVFELRHGLELILGSREHGVVRIPFAVRRVGRSPVGRRPVA